EGCPAPGRRRRSAPGQARRWQSHLRVSTAGLPVHARDGADAQQSRRLTRVEQTSGARCRQIEPHPERARRVGRARRPAEQIVTLSARRSSGERDAPPRVLVVDDAPELRRSLARLLLSRGMGVLTAGGGSAAIDILKKEPIDVALFDLMMPNIDGIELMERTRAERLEVEVIIMTAFGDVETA